MTVFYDWFVQSYKLSVYKTSNFSTNILPQEKIALSSFYETVRNFWSSQLNYSSINLSKYKNRCLITFLSVLQFITKRTNILNPLVSPACSFGDHHSLMSRMTLNTILELQQLICCYNRDSMMQLTVHKLFSGVGIMKTWKLICWTFLGFKIGKREK